MSYPEKALMEKQVTGWATLDKDARHTLIAAIGGWMFDAFDVMLLALLAAPIMKDLGFTPAKLALVFSVQLGASAMGGIVMGTLADYIGRKKALMINILVYALSTGAVLFANSLTTLLVLRFLTGLGLGGEWALSMTLISERIPAGFRGRAVALGNAGWPLGTLLAAVFAFYLYPALGWRATFALAAFPALFVLWIRQYVPESELWLATRKTGQRQKTQNQVSLLEIFSKKYVRYTLLVFLAILCTMFSYWMFWTWLPTYLVNTRGFTLSKSSLWMIITQIGALAGYMVNGLAQDKLGRRFAMSLFSIGEAVMIGIFLALVTNAAYVYIIVLLLGFFTGYWASYGSIVTETFPTRIRATAAGVTYNCARAINLFGPVIVSSIAAATSWNMALAMPAVAATLAGLLIWTLPETKGRDLSAID
ncbi:MFS transporter [Desulfofundulus thermocisternus]|uniref:MFS transporter n=1 Tax=Desulfofundulus thermocisternus TaxID=42471 RepID=UPI00217DF144|nr:MFS transporter [Desulfofundulus thermocisternus]MCS5695715.1 MFS transporter [Desulfofundulus thermocisternus]